MMRSDYKLEFIRNKKSHDFIINKNYKYVGNGKNKRFTTSDYNNNTKNNMLDSAKLYKKDTILWECNKVQTVANYPLADTQDTLALGSFQIICFIDPRNYNHEIHGVINAYDIEGQRILENSMQWEDQHWKGRFLIHATQYNHAWSKACLMFHLTPLLELNSVLHAEGINSCDIIWGYIRGC